MEREPGENKTQIYALVWLGIWLVKNPNLFIEMSKCIEVIVSRSVFVNELLAPSHDRPQNGIDSEMFLVFLPEDGN
ncbi:MAG: hypothetical protein HY268_02370 [Deltaproteobacteria bacterium]|nr:hypothetical protein [Deltaproteobacteria bacterium]